MSQVLPSVTVPKDFRKQRQYRHWGDSLINVQAATDRYDQSRMEGTRNIGIGGNAGTRRTSGFMPMCQSGAMPDRGWVRAINVVLGFGSRVGGTAPISLTGDIEVLAVANFSNCCNW